MFHDDCTACHRIADGRYTLSVNGGPAHPLCLLCGSVAHAEIDAGRVPPLAWHLAEPARVERAGLFDGDGG